MWYSIKNRVIGLKVMNTSGKTLMILGGSELQLPAIEKAIKMGHKVIVCDYYEVCAGKSVPGVIGELISTYDYEGVLKTAKKYHIDGITTLCTDYPMRIVAKVAETLGLPGITYKAAFTATDKAAMRRCLEKAGVPIPKYISVNTREEYEAAIKQFKEKCVVKAVDNSGSRGIQLIYDINDSMKINEAYNYCKEFSRSGELLIEEFMEGPEVCVETLNYKGQCYPIQITDQLAKEPPFFTDAGYSQPTFLSDDIKNQINDIAIRANIALENFMGSSCTEIIVTKDGPKVVEVGPRLAGDYMTSHLVPLSTGVDMVDAIIKIALGEAPDLEKKYNKGSCIRYYMKPVVGKIKTIEGIEAAKNIPGVNWVHMMKEPGDMAVELRSSNDRIGFVMAQGDTSEAAINACETALNLINVVTE